MKVVDYFTGASISNLQGTLDGEAITAVDGKYCSTELSPGVHPLSLTASGYTTFNGAIQSPGGATSRTVKLFAETSAMKDWLAQVNSDRAANGAGAVTLDDMLSIAAFNHAADMAVQNYFAHFDPMGFSPNTRSLLLGSMVMGAENLSGGDSNWAGAESGFMAEKSQLPNQSASDCAQDDSEAGHYCNIVWPSHNWVGLAVVHFENSTYQNYYDQEFGDLYGYYDTTVLGTTPPLGDSVALDFVGANGATLQGEGIATISSPTPIPISTLNADPTCATSCPASDPWYPPDATNYGSNPLEMSLATKQIYFAEVDTSITAFVGYGAYAAAFAGGTGPTQYSDASYNVQSQ